MKARDRDPDEAPGGAASGTTRGELHESVAAPTVALVLLPLLRAAGEDRRTPESRLAEAVGLAEAIALDIAEARVVPVRNPRPATLFGSGTLDDLTALVRTADAKLVVIDHPLTPVQQRNLEKALSAKVLDRTALILEIFGERAQTAEGALQVELAHLNYQRSRLVRSWTHLERQRGGFGFLGGPGETQIEADRRQIAERIANVETALEGVRRTRALAREKRRRNNRPVVALVGYTNAGKSTLFNRLVHANVESRDLLFATLDPTMRRLSLPHGRVVLLSDTVGFVSHLPTALVAAFRATLEEVALADVIVHVRDIAHPETEAQARDVEDTLREIGVDLSARPMIEAWNKIDLLPAAEAELCRSVASAQGAITVSALSGDGTDALLGAVETALARRSETFDLRLSVTDGARLAWLYRNAEVLGREDDEGGISLTVRIPDALRADARHRLGLPLDEGEAEPAGAYDPYDGTSKAG